MTADKKTKKRRTKTDDDDKPTKKRKASSTAEEVNALPNGAPDGSVLISDFTGLSEETKRALVAGGKSVLFPIQVRVWSAIYEDKKDVLVRAKTGTGKTLAFALPICDTIRAMHKTRNVKALILAPTRELAQQVEREFHALSKELKTLCCYGGAPYGPQCSALRAGMDIVVGTPGRVKDLIEKEVLKVNNLHFAVLDEADQMLDMGFEPELEAIFHQARFEQLLLFSATMPNWVSSAAKKYSTKPLERIDLVLSTEASSNLDIRHVCIPAHWQQVHSVIDDILTEYSGGDKSLVFCETKVECNEMMESRQIQCSRRVLHGDVQQREREKTIDAFKKGAVTLLIATDVAARGLDLTVDLVIMNKPPITRSGRADVETYTHRSGRTGRAGRKGTCVTLYSPRQRDTLRSIETALKTSFEWRGAPRPVDIVTAKAKSVIDQINAVDDNVVPLFAATAESFADASTALAKAIACIAGYNEAPPPRSLLSNAENYVTCQFDAHKAMSHSSYVWTALRRKLPAQIADNVKGLRLTHDSTAAVFDLPADALGHLKDDPAYLTDLTELPKLKEYYAGPSSPGRGGGRGGWRNGRSSHGSSSSFGGRSRGRRWQH